MEENIILRMHKRQDPKRMHCSQVFTRASPLDTLRNRILNIEQSYAQGSLKEELEGQS